MYDSIHAAGAGLTPEVVDSLKAEVNKKYEVVRHKVLGLMEGHHPVGILY